MQNSKINVVPLIWTAFAIVFVLVVALIMACSPLQSNETTSSISSNATSSDISSLEITEPAVQTEETSTLSNDENVESSSASTSFIEVNGMSLSTDTLSLLVGESQMPIVTMTPNNATDKSEIWTSDNEAVATVDQIGNITGISAGTCTVTVKSSSNSNVSAEVKVTVTPIPQQTVSSTALAPVTQQQTVQMPEHTSVWGTPTHNGLNQTYATLRCESAGINAPIVWGYGQLDNNSIICQGSDTYIFGTSGTKVLASHNNGIFSRLQYVSVGDRFVIDTNYGQFVYEVVSCRVGTMNRVSTSAEGYPQGFIYADDGTSLVELNSAVDALYAYTCYPFGSTGNTSQRLVVKAIPVE